MPQVSCGATPAPSLTLRVSMEDDSSRGAGSAQAESPGGVQREELNCQTLNYYFDYLGHEVAYRETPEGPDVLAVGDEEILALTKDMSLEEQLRIRRWLP